MKVGIKRVNMKVVFGPGGMKCNCCTHGKPCECKVMISRADRRTNKQKICLINLEE